MNNLATSSKPLALLCALAACVALSGCAGASAARKIAGQAAAGSRAAVKSEPTLADVRPGTSTREDLLALLGPTAKVQLDNGYEVWAYKLNADRPGDPPKGEFVVLLKPSGVVAKTRLRMAPVAVPGTAQARAEEQGDAAP